MTTTRNQKNKPARDSATIRPHSNALRIHGTVARDLGVAIVSGKHKAGRVLEGEIDASVRLQVSRSAYREAVKILTAKGLVESRPKVGTWINRREHWHMLDPDVLAWLFESEPKREIIDSLFELRAIIEPQAAALAAERRSKKDISAMRAALDRMEKLTLHTQGGRQADQDFHAALLRASNNVFLTSLISGIRAAIEWTTLIKLGDHSKLRDAIPDHRRVFNSIAASDPDSASKAMRQLIELALSDTHRLQRARRKSD